MFRLMSKLVKSRKAALPSRRPALYRPTLEDLEGRLAPAALAVSTVADNTTADTALTLREAILVVDGTLGRALTPGEQARVSGSVGSSNTIQFDLPAGS